MSDRILIMYEGRMTGELDGKEAVEDVRTTPPGYYDAGNGWTGGNANDQTA